MYIYIFFFFQSLLCYDHSVFPDTFILPISSMSISVNCPAICFVPRLHSQLLIFHLYGVCLLLSICHYLFQRWTLEPCAGLDFTPAPVPASNGQSRSRPAPQEKRAGVPTPSRNSRFSPTPVPLPQSGTCVTPVPLPQHFQSRISPACI